MGRYPPSPEPSMGEPGYRYQEAKTIVSFRKSKNMKMFYWKVREVYSDENDNPLSSPISI